MGILNPHQGSWLGMPDYGITEAIGGLLGTPRTAQGGSNILGTNQSSANNNNNNLNNYNISTGGPQYNPPVVNNIPTNGQVLGSGTSSSGSGTNRNSITQNAINSVNQGVGEDTGLVQAEYDQAMNDLAGQEQNAYATYGNMGAQVQAQGAAQGNRLAEGKQEQLDTAAQGEQTAQQTQQQGLRTMRDTYNQLQQKNIADLSARGISSSSVAEALAEKLGVETMRRIGDITQGTQNVLNNIAKEKNRIVQVFNNKKAELDQSIALQVQDVQNKLAYALDQVRSQRGLAALQKQKGITDIAQQARQMIDSIKQNAWEYEQKLAAEAQRRTQATNDAMALLTYNQQGEAQLNPMVSNTVTALQQANPGLGYAPNAEMIKGQPYVTGYSTYQKKEEDPLDAYINQQLTAQ